MPAFDADKRYVARVVAFLRAAQPARVVANALLELGLPRVRAWLREKAGPGADVGEIRIEKDGALVHLDRLRVPIGARGVLVLDHASATIVHRKSNFPEARLSDFTGVLTFGSGTESFRAEISFVATNDANEDAWISGDLGIARATWTTKSGNLARAMTGKARLFVSPSSWRLEDGLLETETNARVRFSAHGVLDGSMPLSEARLVLETARVGPFADALTAIGGQALSVPAFVPLDALLRGEIVWDEDGGRCALTIASEALDATIRARVEPDGSGLDGRVEADLRPAVPLRAANVPPKALPRAEDRLRIEVDVKGRVDHPIARGLIRAPQIGFRFGRARFLPSPVLRAIEGTVDVEGNKTHARIRATAGQGTIIVEADTDLREPSDVRATATVEGLDGSFVREVLSALGLPSAVPRELRASAKLRGEGSTIAGTVRLETPRSHVAIDPLRLTGRDVTGTRISANIAFADLAAAFSEQDVRPRGDGSIVVALEGKADAEELEGSFEIGNVAFEIASRPDVLPFALEAVNGRVIVGRTTLRVPEVRARAYDGNWRAEATVPFGASPTYAVWVENASSALLAQLADVAGGRLKVRVARDGERPTNEVWLAEDARVVGEIRGRPVGPAIADVAFETSSGTALVFHGEIGASVDGSTLRGNVALADAIHAGLFAGSALQPLADGTVRIDAKLKGAPATIVVLGYAYAPTLRIDLGAKDVDPLVITDASTLFRIDEEKTIWHRAVGRMYGGFVTSAGVLGHGAPSAPTGARGTIAIANVALEDLPSERGTLAPFVRGSLSATFRFEQKTESDPFRGKGTAQLDNALFPFLARGATSLAKYGLRPPSEEAIAPVTLDLALDERGFAFDNIHAWVKGASATGDVRVGADGTMLGYVTVLLEEDYLRSSAVLVLPRVLTERLTLPVRLKGTLARPVVDVDLGACFNKFVTENRVSSFFISAVEEAAVLFGAHPVRPPEAGDPPPASAQHGDDALFADLIAPSAEWDEIEMRLEDHRRSQVRYRIG